MSLSIRQPVIVAVLSFLFIFVMLPQPGSTTLKANSSVLRVPDHGLQPEDSGRFFDFTGETLPW